jgi:hypothetical protein
MATPGKFSDRVELPHYTLGGLPDVDHSRPYFCPVGGAIDGGARGHASGAVLAPLLEPIGLLFPSKPGKPILPRDPRPGDIVPRLK